MNFFQNLVSWLQICYKDVNMAAAVSGSLSILFDIPVYTGLIHSVRAVYIHSRSHLLGQCFQASFTPRDRLCGMSVAGFGVRREFSSRSDGLRPFFMFLCSTDQQAYVSLNTKLTLNTRSSDKIVLLVCLLLTQALCGNTFGLRHGCLHCLD